MQFKKTLVRLLLILFPLVSAAQTTYFPQGDKANILIERLEIKRKNDSTLNFSKVRPLSRQVIINNINQWRNSAEKTINLSKVDQYNLNSLLMNNIEFLADKNQFKSRKPLAKRFYQTPASLYEVHIKDFDLVINPVILLAVSKVLREPIAATDTGKMDEESSEPIAATGSGEMEGSELGSKGAL